VNAWISSATGTLPKRKQSRWYPYVGLFVTWIDDYTLDHRIERRCVGRFKFFAVEDVIQLQSTSPPQAKRPDKHECGQPNAAVRGVLPSVTYQSHTGHGHPMTRTGISHQSAFWGNLPPIRKRSVKTATAIRLPIKPHPSANSTKTCMVLIVFSAGYWLQGNRIEAIRLFPKY
jgi:hypothetical protein